MQSLVYTIGQISGLRDRQLLLNTHELHSIADLKQLQTACP
jgi:hypothetical protein